MGQDLLSNIRLADEVRRYGENRAATLGALKDQCVAGRIADLKSGEDVFLKSRPLLAAEIADLVGRPTAFETRAFFARELPRPGFWRRSFAAVKARFGGGAGDQ